MRVLFLTLGNIKSLEEHGIYQDLIRTFLNNEHCVDVVCPAEESRTTAFTDSIPNGRLLHVACGNVQKTGLIKKGINTILLESRFKRAIRQNLSDVKYDLIVYSTPPITLAGAVRYIKRRDNAKTYLLLKDIFPQNAVDLGMMSRHSIKAPLYWYFRRKEKQLYALSDHIGCMSQANADYVLRHNPEVDPRIVEVCPNSIEVKDMRIGLETRKQLREKYGIPSDKKVFVYGGNLGKPQGIPFITECLKAQEQNPEAYFLVVGNGTEYGKLKKYFDSAKPKNMKLMPRLPKEDYDHMIASCDVGLVFLDHRFTIPNFPSRILSYMQAGLPVLACTDPNTDVGKTITDGGFGWWCESADASCFAETVEKIMADSIQEFGKNSWEYLNKNYNVERAYSTIIKSNT